MIQKLNFIKLTYFSRLKLYMPLELGSMRTWLPIVAIIMVLTGIFMLNVPVASYKILNSLIL